MIYERIMTYSNIHVNETKELYQDAKENCLHFVCQHQWPEQENPLKVCYYPEKQNRPRNREWLKNFTTHIAPWWSFISPCASHMKLVSHKALLRLPCINVISATDLHTSTILQVPRFYTGRDHLIFQLHREWKCLKIKSLKWSDTWLTILALQVSCTHINN